MTLPPSRIGDKGHRYEVQAFGYPKENEWNVIGWAAHHETAQEMASSIILAPGCTEARIVDREADDYAEGGA